MIVSQFASVRRAAKLADGHGRLRDQDDAGGLAHRDGGRGALSTREVFVDAGERDVPSAGVVLRGGSKCTAQHEPVRDRVTLADTEGGLRQTEIFCFHLRPISLPASGRASAPKDGASFTDSD